MATVIKGGATGPIGVEAFQRSAQNFGNAMGRVQNLGNELQDRRDKKADDYYTSVIAPLIANSGGPQMASKVNPGAFMKWFDMSGNSANKAIDMTSQLSSGQLTVPELLAKSGMEWSIGNVAPYDDDIQAIVDNSKLSGDPAGLDRAYELAQTRFEETGDPIYNQQMTGIEAQRTALSGDKIPLGTPTIDNRYQRRIDKSGMNPWAAQTPGLPAITGPTEFRTMDPALAQGMAGAGGVPFPSPSPGGTPPALGANAQPTLSAEGERLYRQGMPYSQAVLVKAGGQAPPNVPGESTVPGMERYDAATGGQDAHDLGVVGRGEGIVNFYAMGQPGVAEMVEQLNAQYPNPVAELAPDSMPTQDAVVGNYGVRQTEAAGAPVMAQGSSVMDDYEYQRRTANSPGPPEQKEPYDWGEALQGFGSGVSNAMQALQPTPFNTERERPRVYGPGMTPVMAEGSSPQQSAGGETAPTDPFKEEETRINHIIKLQEMAGKTQDPQVQRMIMGNLGKLGWQPPPPPPQQPQLPNPNHLPAPQQGYSMGVKQAGPGFNQSHPMRNIGGQQYYAPNSSRSIGPLANMGQAPVNAGGRVPYFQTGRNADGSYPVTSTPPAEAGYGVMTRQEPRAEDGYSMGPPAGPLNVEEWINAVRNREVEMADVPEALYEQVFRGMQTQSATDAANTADPTFPIKLPTQQSGLDASGAPTNTVRGVTKTDGDGNRGYYGSELDDLRSRYSAAGLEMDPDEGVPVDASPQDMAYYNAINQVFNKGISGQGASDQAHRRQNATGYDVDIVPTEEGNRFSTMEEWNPAWGTPVEEFTRNGVSLVEYRPGEQAPEETTPAGTTPDDGGGNGGGKKRTDTTPLPENPNPVRAGKARRYIAAHKNDWQGQNDSQQVQNFMNMAFPEGNATLMDFLNDPATAMDSRTKKATLEESARQFDEKLKYDRDLFDYEKLKDQIDLEKGESWFEANPEIYDEVLEIQAETQRLREKVLEENPKWTLSSPELDDALGLALQEAGLLDRVNWASEVYANALGIENMTGYVQAYDSPGFVVRTGNWLSNMFNKDARDKANEAWRLDHPDGVESRTVPTGTNFLSATEEAAQISADIAAKYNR